MKQSILKPFIILSLFLWIGMSATQAQKRSEKRGLSYDIPYVRDLRLLTPGVSWYYNWSVAPKDPVVNKIAANNMEYIPMAWNGYYNRDMLRKYLLEHPEVKYLLGFNEPNFKDQANMTPSEAAAKWPELEAIADEFGLKIVSPAVNYNSPEGSVSENGTTYTDPVKYLDDFFAACPDCRVDYVAVHCYMNYPEAVQWYISQFKKYKKPIWLTEFCSGEGGVTPEQQLNSMVRKVEYLETDNQVYRYAWFIGRTDPENAYPYMQLFPGGNKGTLTQLGDIYVHMSPFDTTKYYQINEDIPAEFYIASSNTSLAPTTDQAGKLDVTGVGNNEWTEYLVEVETPGTYYLKLRIANQEESLLTIYSDEKQLISTMIGATGSLTTWKTETIPVEMPAGKQRLRIKQAGSSFNLNRLMMSDSQNAGVHRAESIPSIQVYPNPVVSTLHIDTDKEIGQLLVCDISGRLLLQESRTKRLEVSILPAGTYLLTVIFADGSQAKNKFVK